MMTAFGCLQVNGGHSPASWPPRFRPLAPRRGRGFRACGGSLDGGREELRESCWRRSCNCWTVASSVATRASSARIYACASTGVRSQISCDNEDGVFIDLYDMRHPPALASMTGWNHVNGYEVFSLNIPRLCVFNRLFFLKHTKLFHV